MGMRKTYQVAKMQDEPERKKIEKEVTIVAFPPAAEAQSWELGLPCPKQDLWEFGSLWAIQNSQGIPVTYPEWSRSCTLPTQ